jgi:putative transposase
MVWKTRICGEQLYHHIYAWGNDRNPVFKNNTHYKKYLSLLQKHAEDYTIDVIAYALMEWHVHLFIYDDLNNVSDFMLKLHGDYAQYFNKETQHVGHVFGERFNNKIVVNNIYGKWLSRYIHRQPLEAKLVDDPKDYPWTSYRVYLGLEKKSFVKPAVILSQYDVSKNSRKQYEQFVLEERDDEPVAWGKRSFTIMNPKHMIRFASKELGVKEAELLKPTGIVERRKRHEAIRLLLDKYGYTKAQIAHAFKLSRMAVTLITKEK